MPTIEGGDSPSNKFFSALAEGRLSGSWFVFGFDELKIFKDVLDSVVQSSGVFNILIAAGKEVEEFFLEKYKVVEPGINASREIISFLGLSAPQSGRKTVIVSANEASLEAQNALLKATEETEEDTLFIFIGQKESDLIPTLKSRCRILGIPDGNWREKSATKFSEFMNFFGKNSADFQKKIWSKDAFSNQDFFIFLALVCRDGMIRGSGLEIWPEENFSNLKDAAKNLSAILMTNRRCLSGANFRLQAENLIFNKDIFSWKN